MVSKPMLEQIKTSLGLQELDSTGRGGGGCINEGETFNSDKGKLFLKRNDREGAKVMFDGELASLQAIELTGCIRVPKAHLVVMDEAKAAKSDGGPAVLVMEYLYLQGGGGNAALAEQLADLHMHNTKLRDNSSQSRVGGDGGERVAYQPRFGFDVPTCCGYLPQNNDWCDDWQVFFTRKLEEQLNKLQSAGRSGREALQLWPSLQRAIPGLFEGVSVLPSLLHGDLWGGNVAQVDEDGGMKPCIFDPASFYGHHEYDLAIAGMFGGFGKGFWNAYFEKIPKEDGWDRRHDLYQLFHYLNHWNHFGSGYADNSLRIMKKLTK